MISLDTYHNNLWKCRDFELQHLWQRSIFLTAFMLLTFTGYGTLLIKMVEVATAGFGADIISPHEPYFKKVNVESVGNNKDYLYLMNIMAQGICIVGMVFSVFWIMMAKASKAWYEVYEKAIRAFEKSVSINTSKSPLKGYDIAGFNYSELPDIKKISIDNSVLSTKGGEYSPSKINVGLGIAMLSLWVFLIFAHVLFVYSDFDLSRYTLLIISVAMPFFAVIILLIIYLLSYQFKGLKSGALENYK